MTDPHCKVSWKLKQVAKDEVAPLALYGGDKIKMIETKALQIGLPKKDDDDDDVDEQTEQKWDFEVSGFHTSSFSWRLYCCMLSSTKVLCPGKPLQEPAERNSKVLRVFSLTTINVVGVDIPT